ncbi:MAG: SH3 domain-containing protein [Chloroflexota bacterium]
MRRVLLCLLLLILTTSALAQEAAPSDDPVPLRARVVVDSVFARVLPDPDAELAASLFENDILEVIGRNADGRFFQVRRPLRENTLGWLGAEFLEYTFSAGALPITDLTTGVTGETLVFDSGVSVLIITEAALRATPDVDGERVGVVALRSTIPAIERSSDGLWLRVNYLGQTGWLAEFLTRTQDDVSVLPIAEQFNVPVIPVEVIPPEVQLGQVERLRAYLLPKQAVAEAAAAFWSRVQQGEVLPCEPPAAGDYPAYSISQRDTVELPELRLLERRVSIITADLNATLQTLARCGIYSPAQIATAYAQAVNASNLITFALREMDRVESIIVEGF